MPPPIVDYRPDDALLIAAADSLPTDALIAWRQVTPPEALAHGEALAALPARARRDQDAAPLRAIVAARLIPHDAPPPPRTSRRRWSGAHGLDERMAMPSDGSGRAVAAPMPLDVDRRRLDG